MSDLDIEISDEPKINNETKNKTNNMKNNDLTGTVWVFTGIRLKDEENVLISRNAKVTTSVSKNTTHLVCKDFYSGSSKLETAKKLGVKIMDVDEFLKFLNE
jgi:NAD-dependent DNA ligase